ncbi:unnamed protein product [Angiostrongylus costaricensis]|uniref:Uncharacterized protein n=1 Tax=Angiostrongylus costaricensis TaxID=334426 RepID=A0A0R3Q2G3_ANGCS|nr:unnamed protein product [Angiostrongylus costaricensis]
MNKVREGTFLPQIPGSFPSAALLAMKPTSGVKRNNAVANAEGGNTAHKKSDVNSKESVVIMPSYNESLNSWQATYPHLLCTTRQKIVIDFTHLHWFCMFEDTVLLDSRAGQIGKRPVFYFYIRATTFSPSGGLSYARSLSLPFTIATRRNQDCQVQRMMSSYTATCFWLYGTSTLDGLILNWSDNGKCIKWSHFKQLYQTYFTVNAEVKRSLSDIDFQLMKEKMECDDCREHATASGERFRPYRVNDALIFLSSTRESVHFEALYGIPQLLRNMANKKGREEPLLTFKNVLCPHLRYDCDQNVLRFSIWRGNLEVLQIFQDARTNVKQLWDDFILHGLTDIDDINEMLSAQPSSVMFLRISYIAGGSICISTRGERGIIHLEPIELKKLQAKSVFEYMADIADFTPLRVAVVTCRETSPETVLPTVPMNDYIGSANHVQVRFRQT